MSAAEQEAVLRARGCRAIIPVKASTRAAIRTFAWNDRTFEMVYAFLLIDQTRKRVRGGLQADFREKLAELEKRGATVFDVTGQVNSREHRKAFLALVDSDIARHNRGAMSATNGAFSQGKPPYEPTRQELKDGKAIWRNPFDYPDWDDADAALQAEINPRFRAARAYALWGGRTPPKKRRK